MCERRIWRRIYSSNPKPATDTTMDTTTAYSKNANSRAQTFTSTSKNGNGAPNGFSSYSLLRPISSLFVDLDCGGGEEAEKEKASSQLVYQRIWRSHKRSRQHWKLVQSIPRPYRHRAIWSPGNTRGRFMVVVKRRRKQNRQIYGGGERGCRW